MSETRKFPFGGVPVYNPQSLSKSEAIAQFHARQSVYESLLDLLRQERPSHVLIIGTRGMGKTTLLQRVRYGVEEDAELGARYLPLVFPEEQYNVNRLDRFYLNMVDALADAQERLGNENVLSTVESFAREVSKQDREEIEQRVPRFLADFTGRTGRNLLLLVDNAERLFETIEDKEQWRFRELLSARKDLTFFGATTQASDGIYGPERAFFEFFKIYKLTPLTLDEVRSLLIRLSESVEDVEGQQGNAKRRMEDWLTADPGRLRTLVHLTGGNPRTTVLLFHLVLDGLTGGAREYLEQLLDQCTPNYKGRVDELPPQAQQVLDAVALRWDPVTASEIADDTRLETSAVSTHLTRLVRQGILEKADAGDSKKALYQVAERFFNIWYLMRASRRVRAKLRWFVEFLRVFFDGGELEALAFQEFDRVRDSGSARCVENAVAYAMASGRGRHRFEEYLRRVHSDREHEWRPYLALFSQEASALGGVSYPKAPHSDGSPASGGVDTPSPADREARLRAEIELVPASGSLWRKLGLLLSSVGERRLEAEAAIRKAIELDPTDALNWGALGALLLDQPERREDAEAAFRKSIEIDANSPIQWQALGLLIEIQSKGTEEAEAAYRKAIELDPNAAISWAGLGRLLASIPDRQAEAEAAYLRAIGLARHDPTSWRGLGCLLARQSRREAEAEAAYRKAIELDPNYASPWSDLGRLLKRQPHRKTEAEEAYRKAIGLDPKDATHWSDLGLLLAEAPSWTDEAHKALRQATELDPNNMMPWIGLGGLFATHGRMEEAEDAFKQAIALDPQNAMSWTLLGHCYSIYPDYLKPAEAAYRRASELDPNLPGPREGLGRLLADEPGRTDEAEAALRKAIELDPKSPLLWCSLGGLLEESPDRSAEAEGAYRLAVDLDPTNPQLWSRLGVYLASHANQSQQAEIALRRSLELDRANPSAIRNLGVLLYCERGSLPEAIGLLKQASQADPKDPVTAAIHASIQTEDIDPEGSMVVSEAAAEADFWGELLALNQKYAPFGKILLRICDLVEQQDSSNPFTRLWRAVALAQLGDFPRASVALEDALVGDPIELLSRGRSALEVFFAAAVREGRVKECVDVLEKKEWIDAWRPIYESLKSVEAGSAAYLKRVAVEIREPASVILRRIAPALPT